MVTRKRSLSLSVPKEPIPRVNLFYSGHLPEPTFSMELFQLMSRYKGFIDIISDSKKWDYAKKLSNNYELINQTGSKGISAVNPISRSYFKLLEIIHDFKLVVPSRDKIVYGAIAEGPGGFVECFLRFRKKYFHGRHDVVQCMTLKSDSNDVPNWNKADNLFNKHQVKVTYGKDGTGNLYNPENIDAFRKEIGGNVADLVTADGGFDYSVDFNKQEQMSSKLIFCELICALAINKKGGNFVLKIFDIYTKMTVKILYLINLFYDEVILTKPHTSRPANSEKYIVCKSFRGITQEQLQHFYMMIDEWNQCEDIQKQYVSDIGGLVVPENYVQALHQYNLYCAKQQMTNILKTLTLIELDLQAQDIHFIKKKQTVYALEWCKKYENSINHLCNHLK